MKLAQEPSILPSPSRVNKLSQDARGLVHRKVLWWHPSNLVFFDSERASLVVAGRVESGGVEVWMEVGREIHVLYAQTANITVFPRHGAGTAGIGCVIGTFT